MIEQLPAYLTQSVAGMRADIPRNPGIVTFLQAKIALLETPNLATDIVGRRLWVEANPASIDGRLLNVVALFPLPDMRDGAAAVLDELARAMPVLEGFMQTPFPSTGIAVWYGFNIGGSGGNAVIDVEDAATYELRTGSRGLPYDATVYHELSHTYISNESLTQFLEMYIYNRLRTGSTDLRHWHHTRDYVAWAPSNKDSAALLDIYQLIGHDPMAQAYRAVHPLRPPYGSPLPEACQLAFVEQSPEKVRSQVAELIARVTF